MGLFKAIMTTKAFKRVSRFLSFYSGGTSSADADTRRPIKVGKENYICVFLNDVIEGH